MRPGEAVAMRADEIDRSGEVWIYRPLRHKTEGHDRVRAIPIGPKAQEVLKPFLASASQAHLFRPRSAVEARNERRKAARKSPMTPSQAGRKRKRSPRRPPGSSYIGVTQQWSGVHVALRGDLLI
jgi:integrase